MSVAYHRKGASLAAAKKPDLAKTILKKLREQGIDLDSLCCGSDEGSQVKLVCVAPNLGDALKEMGQSPRDHVVMVRVDEDTLTKLDAWVETGAVRSRSEAAALLLREGLGVRGNELAGLKEALEGVTKARQRLKEKASKVLGTDRSSA
jgi:hypothetical protein